MNLLIRTISRLFSTFFFDFLVTFLDYFYVSLTMTFYHAAILVFIQVTCRE